MRGSKPGTFASVALVAIAAIVGAGCGDDDETTTQAAGGDTGGGTLEIKMGEFFFDPENAEAEAGRVTIEAPNEGKVEHELVVFKSDLNPAKLPTDSDGEVDEEELEQTSEEEGEIEEVEPGQTGKKTFNLPAGKYVMFCNLPGHYAQGMYGTITVGE